MNSHAHSYLYVLAAAIAAAPMLPAPERKAAPELMQTEFIDPDSAEAATVRRIGDNAIQWLGARLIREAKVATSQSEPAEAVASCHLKSVGRNDQVLPGMPSITAIKYTSSRVFNPANAPDAAEELVLERIQQELEAGTHTRSVVIQRITTLDGAMEWRAYRPLGVLPECLACHGDPGKQPPELRMILTEKFPDAEASGYKLGEWRGLLRVSVKPPATSETARK